jgi:hypothetical protein
LQSVFAQFFQRRQLVILRFLVFTTLVAFCAPVRSDIIVDVQDATIAANGSGFVNVLISSNGTLTDLIQSFGFEFQISAPTVNGALRFSAVQSDSETIATSPDYVFLGDSTNFNANRQDPDEQRLVGGDAASANVNIAGGPFLMARLEIEHLTGTPLAAVGETFTISLVPGVNTDFLDENLVSLTQGIHSSGLVTITSAAVPEPGTLGVLLAGSAVGLWWKRRSKSQNQHRESE